MDNVDKVEINFAAKTATVILQPGHMLSKEQCDAAFKGSPYEISSVKEEPHTGSPG